MNMITLPCKQHFYGYTTSGTIRTSFSWLLKCHKGELTLQCIWVIIKTRSFLLLFWYKNLVPIRFIASNIYLQMFKIYIMVQVENSYVYLLTEPIFILLLAQRNRTFSNKRGSDTVV